ncbi:hypothetical protein [Solitalea canadensis]|uniref:NERD domain-containing protein n=1 Tax=Solitalea canadensis (strain ATCC 29591 / DSM 3403 / JCM 21819 / LMG 8368 / NBRC 15130 / NCIMB 12057 / USAM 9D) TaxID=929556 RepID=H8KXL1_SOLCM|nr:hypothetical protein [Solitalea canadensis]AFD05307.1 hypothetical protein Solca_0154 [Solitalea canadensis DSM 3403]
MHVHDINLKKISKEILIEYLIKNVLIKPAKRELKEILTKIERSISNADYLTTRNGLIISIYFNYDETFKIIKRKGLFRYSKYINQKCIVKNLALDLLEICDRFGCLTDKTKIYLNSIITFSPILESYKDIDKFIIQEIKRFETNYPNKSLIKTLVSFVDFLFLVDHMPNKVNDLMDLNCRTKEDISAAVSFLTFFYSDRIKNKNVNITFISEEYILSNEISKLLIPVCFLLDYKDFEVQFDHFDYYCVLKNDKLFIAPPFENFEKAVRLGYIRTEIQYLNDRLKNENNALSIEDFTKDISNLEGYDFFKYTETYNYPRYSLQIPENFYDHLINSFVKSNELFKEEVIYLASVFKEQLLNPADLEGIKLKNDLSLFDIIKIRRLFLILYQFFSKEIYKKEKKGSDLLFRSLIPVLSEKNLATHLQKVVSEDKADAFLDIVCWESNLDSFLDLQYHPILYFDGYFLIALSVLSNSNFVRNIYASEYKRGNVSLLKDGENDPLLIKLANSFSEAKIQCYIETKIENTDIDLCAIYENTLFIFECKHNLHPVSPFDLRTTFDYIKKAENQLDKITNSFNNGHLINTLEAKHHISLSKVDRIQCCIVLSNRLLNGNIFKYPVRNINEIDNMLTRGVMKTEFGEFWLWKEKKLSLDFLLNYFSIESELTTLHFESLSQEIVTYELSTPKLETVTYFWEYNKAIISLKRYIGKLDKVN